LTKQLNQLLKLEDAKDHQQRKASAIGAGSKSVQNQSVKEVKKGGYQLFHLILVALVGLLFGAFITKSQ